MPTYTWTCPACGHSNLANTEACAICRCPAKSTLEQRRAHRAEFDGTGPPVRMPTPQVVSASVGNALARIRRTVVFAILAGSVVSLLAAAWLHQYWAWSSSKGGVGTIGLVCVALVFGPCAKYLVSLRCPRCGKAWLSQSHSPERNGAFILWAFATWRSCASCGLSVKARVEGASA